MGQATVALPGATFPEPDEPGSRRVIYSIAMGSFLASFAMNFWWPFLPLYLLKIGATDHANALFWVSIATAVQGVARLVTGPMWGSLSDKYGRKLMLVRALYAATATTIVAALAQAPWVIVVSLSMQGLFSGFNPAAVALTSVSVPDRQIPKALGVVTAGQYLGGTLGPAVGALLAIWLGYRGAIVVSAILPSIAATWILFAVPRDIINRQAVAAVASAAATKAKRRFRLSLAPFKGYPTLFWLMVVLYFGLFALNQFIRVATPVVLEEMVGEDSAKGLSGIAFSIAGGASVIGVTVLVRLLDPKLGVRKTLMVLTLASAAVMPLMAVSFGPYVYLAGFSIFALANSGSMPGTKALIASTVGPERRGSAFGLASSAQALALMIGPFSAAYFAKHSLPLGYMVVAGCFVLLALMLMTVRERKPVLAPVDAAERVPSPSAGGR